MSNTEGHRRGSPGRPAPRGPKRPPGAPVGPEQVRSAVLDAAARLFAEQGVSKVSLRDIAEGADVDVALIRRYVGVRDELIDEVYRSVRSTLVAELEAKPLGQLDHGRQSNLGRWICLLSYYSTRAIPAPADGPDPILNLASTLESENDLDSETAKVRAAQVTAISIGWRLFEDHLVRSTGLSGLPVKMLRDDLTEIQRRIGAIPWPTAPE